MLSCADPPPSRLWRIVHMCIVRIYKRWGFEWMMRSERGASIEEGYTDCICLELFEIEWMFDAVDLVGNLGNFM